MAFAHSPASTGAPARSAKAGEHIDAVGAVVLVGPEQSVTDALLAGLAELDPGGDLTTRLTEGLEGLAGARFRVTDSEPPLAVLRSSPGRPNPSTLLDLLADEDLASALDLALGGLSAGDWALLALAATTVHDGRSRRRVGRDLEAILAAPMP
jgi:hypothetical protein